MATLSSAARVLNNLTGEGSRVHDSWSEAKWLVLGDKLTFFEENVCLLEQ
jgi:hypothetical protein